MKRRIISSLLTVLIMCAMVSLMAVTASAEASGNCGADEYGHPSDKVKWEYVADEKTLYIRGTGYMHYYHWNYDCVPWWDYRDDVEKVVIEDGVRSISDYAFVYFSKIETIYFPGSVENIGYEAVYECDSLKRVTMDEGVQNVDKYAFYNCPELTEVYIPSTLKTLGKEAFCYSPLKVVRFGAYSASERNYTDGGDTFYGCAPDCKFLYNEEALHYKSSINGHYRTDPYGEVHYKQEKHYFGEDAWAPHTVKWEGDMCTASKTCLVCGYEITSTAKGEYSEDSPATCVSSSTGHYVVGALLFNFSKQATEANSIIYGDPDPNAHAFGEWELIEAPTCVKKGSQKHVCSLCGTVETADIAPTGNHSYGSWEETVQPTCYEKGSEERVCSVCGKKETADIAIKKHEIFTYSKGFALYCQCKNCGACYYDIEGRYPMADPESESFSGKDTYINADGENEKLPGMQRVIFGSLSDLPFGEENKETWYYAYGEGTVSSRLNAKGSVHLVLMDGARLTCLQGIHVCSGSSLTIYAQSAAEETMGCLIVPGAPQHSAGIGGDENKGDVAVMICGGKLELRGGYSAAGIGGGSYSNNITITIKNGTVSAIGGNYGAGIGGGQTDNNVVVTIENGTVTATGGCYAAGIGCGYLGQENTVIIKDGTVTATGGEHGAGIGSGNSIISNNSSATVILYGGTIDAHRGSDFAEDIGKGWDSECTVEDYRGVSGSTLSDGNMTIVVGAACLAVALVGGLLIGKKKKNSAAAEER